jgi:DMSO/TMAO reductase YedYZ molybdopterin-dependent catalytic subunit
MPQHHQQQRQHDLEETMTDSARPVLPPEPPRTARREFLAQLAGLSALAAAGTRIPDALAQTAPPPDPPGTVPNEAVLAQKVQGFQTHSTRPLTGSIPAEMHDFDVTPSDRMFIRNNLFTPDLDASKHVLRVTGLVDRPLELSLAELKKLRSFTTQSMLECAGSGRSSYQPKASGTPWLPTGGMGCPQWTGVSLADLLNLAGLKAGAAHVAFTGEDVGALPTVPKVIRSIPMSKAMERHTMVVWGMNGADLPKAHGYPLRALVPGWVGSASIKWLSGIEVLDAPFKGTYMDRSYRYPPYPIEPGEKMPPGAVSTQAWPVKSIITNPSVNAKYRQRGLLVVRGSAWAGDNDIDMVEVSFDEGVSWERAKLWARTDRYAWRRWSLEAPVSKVGYLTILARATDDKGNVQPILPKWNPLGYYWNGIHRVGILVEPA